MTFLVAALLLLAPQESEPGLVAEYFALDATPDAFPTIPAGRKPTFVRVETTIHHAPVTGDFHGTKLAENFFARWTGTLTCEQEGLHNFYVESDDGCRLYIDDELVVDNATGRAMEQRADRMTLKPGPHRIRFEYVQTTGPAGVNLQWRMPKGGRMILPAKFLSHPKGAEKIDWDRDAWEQRPAPPAMQPVALTKPGRYATIDFGPFVTRYVGPASAPVSLAGHLLRLSPDSFVCFDPRQLQVAAVWTGSFLAYNPEKDGVVTPPTIAGKLWFRNPPVPDGPNGRWRGLYVHGRNAVLSYTIEGADVLELHAFENGAFTRTIEIRNVAAPVRIVVAPESADAGLTGAGASFQKRDGRLELEVAQSGRYKIAIPNRKVGEPQALEPLTKGGGIRWGDPVVTKGILGSEPGAYQVDTLTVPYDNPWDSYMRISAIDFLPDGRPAIATLDGDVWIVSASGEKLEELRWKRFAAGLCQPMGLRVVDGKIHVLGRDQITRLHDLNGDGEADFYENFNNDATLGPNLGEYAMDLQVGPDGDFYYAKAGSTGSNSTPHGGTVLRVSKDGSKTEIFALGFRTPFGLCVGPDGFITATDQQGNYMAECPVVQVKKGGFYGFVLDRHPRTKTMAREPAITWLPMEVDNSSGGQVWATGDRWGPLRGRLIHTSYGQSRLLLMVMDEARTQGGAVRFPLQFASGIMRAQFSPVDGQLYVVGLRGWQTTGVKDGCLQRVRYTGKPAHLPVSLKVRKTGLDVTFTDPLDPETAGDPDSYSAQWFNVVNTADYGSPEFNATDPAKRGRQKAAITAATLLEGGKTVSLEIEGFRPVTNLLIKYSLRGADGATVRNEVSLTINTVPD